MASSPSSSSSSRVGHAQQQQLQRASSAPVVSPEASTSNSGKSNVKLSVTNKALTTSAKRYSVSLLLCYQFRQLLFCPWYSHICAERGC